MKLEIGMYVRTINGKIWVINSQQAISGHRKDIINASYNIIDLIEIGDLVRLFMENDGEREITNIFEVVAITNNKKEIGVLTKDFEIEFFPIENLRGIATKEQFESMEYKIGE